MAQGYATFLHQPADIPAPGIGNAGGAGRIQRRQSAYQAGRQGRQFDRAAVNSKLRRAVRTRGQLSGDEAAMELLYLVLNRAVEVWKRPPREWYEAKTPFAILYGDRFVV